MEYQIHGLRAVNPTNDRKYLFIAPFFVTYSIFKLYPLFLTIYNSFFENYRSGLKQIGPNFVGLSNYIKLFTPDANGTIDILKYAGNTIVLWLGGAIPQIVIALLLAILPVVAVYILLSKSIIKGVTAGSVKG